MAQLENDKGYPPYPGEDCHIPPRLNWTEQEKWVWKQVCEGKIADFNEKEGRKEEDLDPKDEKTEWPESRVLSPKFLETILLHEPFRSAIGRNGVEIIGAWFKESVNLDNAHIKHELYLKKTRFDSDVSFDTAHIEGILSVSGSFFKKKAYFHRVCTGGSLFLRDGALFNGEVNLASANIGGQLAMAGSTFKQKVNMNGLKVGTDLFMRDNATFEGEIDLTGANIGGQLSMTGSTFKQKVKMGGLKVGETLFMRNAIFQVEVDLVFSNVGANLDLRGTEMKSLDLSGTIIKGDLRLGKWINDKIVNETAWKAEDVNDMYLILKNVHADALQDSKGSWPKNIDLEGFTYDRLGGMVEPWHKADSIAERDIEWIKGWLYKHVKHKGFSPQPYEQMAKVLNESGHKDKANEVMYTCKDLERINRKDFFGRLNLFLQNIFIGYGYKMRCSVFWSVLFVLLGMHVYIKNGLEDSDEMCHAAAYSLARFLPLTTLFKQFEHIELKGFPLFYFNFHSLMGYVLATFIIAGLTGLTKK